MSNPQTPVTAGNLVPPPVLNLPWGQVQGGMVMLTPSAIEFLQTLWASIQGSGGVIDIIALAAGSPSAIAATAEAVMLEQGSPLTFLSPPPNPLGIQTLLDMIGVGQGDILYRGADRWVVLSPGILGQILQTGGPAADPSWITPTPPFPPATTFAGLPPTPADGEPGFITDSSLPALGNFGAAAAGGGTDHVPVFWDGGTSAWLIG